MSLEEKLKEIEDTHSRRKANFCEDCLEWVEEPQAVCRYDGKRGHIFVNAKPGLALLAALRRCREQRDGWCSSVIHKGTERPFIYRDDAELLRILEGK